jgi:sortase A
MTAATLTPPVAAAPGRRRARPAPTWPRVALVTSALTLWCAAFGLVLSAQAEHSAQSRLYADFRAQLAAGTAPLGAVAPGTPVALLEIPRLRQREVVVEGTDGQDLRQGPGHRRDTVLPGQEGVSVLYGRAATSGAPFGGLAALRKGDALTVTTGQGVVHFVVDRVRRPGDPLPAPLAAGGARVVLGSVEGTGWRSNWAANSPVYVDATLKGAALPAAPRAQRDLPAAEQLGGVDTSRLVYVVLWLQLLVLAALVLTWSLSRWGAPQAWLAGVPVVLALLWVTSNEALTLLPNVL